MNKPEIMSVEEASAILGINSRRLKKKIQEGACPFGDYERNGKSNRGTYIIYRTKMSKTLGREV